MCAAVNVIKRLSVIQGQFVILRQREVFHVTPLRPKVKALVNTTVGTHHNVIWISRIKDYRVHVPVLVRVLHVTKRLSAICRLLYRRPHEVQPVKMMRTSENFLIIVGSGAAAHCISTLLPTRTGVIGSPDAALATIQLYRGVKHIRVLV